mgnify:CR=1 FL=1
MLEKIIKVESYELLNLKTLDIKGEITNWDDYDNFIEDLMNDKTKIHLEDSDIILISKEGKPIYFHVGKLVTEKE